MVFFVAAKPKALSADFVVDQGIPTQVSIGSGAEHVIKVYFTLLSSSKLLLFGEAQIVLGKESFSGCCNESLFPFLLGDC